MQYREHEVGGGDRLFLREFGLVLRSIRASRVGEFQFLHEIHNLHRIRRACIISVPLASVDALP